MREILFRGKSIYNDEWLYGDLSMIRLENSSYIAYNETTGRRPCIRVISNTVGEYTGLNDRHRKTIFEGDIVECSDVINGIKFTARIVFGKGRFQLKHIKGNKPNLDISLWADMEETGKYIEVIGNIYDNPELIKEDEQ